LGERLKIKKKFEVCVRAASTNSRCAKSSTEM